MKHHFNIQLRTILGGALSAMALWSASAFADAPSAALDHDNEARYRKLDRLQALGVGMLHQQTPRPPAPRDPDSATADPRPMTIADFQRQAAQQNAKSAAALSADLEKITADCDGKLVQWPEIGMSDDIFRRCTMHAHFGNAYQVVVSEDGAVPLRLYMFASERAHKVYTVGGVITAIHPR